MGGPLKNGKHEAFAQYVSEGETFEAAYEKAGYKPSRPHASRLATDGNVKARIAELQERRAKQADVTVASITKELEEIRGKAILAGQNAAAVTAVMGKAKLHGLIVDKSEITRKRSIDELDDAEIDALIASAENGKRAAEASENQSSRVH